ncbi:MAG TPA: hypothetical protein DCR97_06985 [Deltaproteobacteria bacterium]|nr:hypothetical protein [Deltaproteobacteria bacterium]
MSLRSKRITVTGGKGFLGKHLIHHMGEKGYENISIADLPEYDLVNREDVQRLYRETRPDIVIHLAAKVGGIGFNQENPASLFYDNAIMGIQLMHEGYVHGVDKFVALGTICAYPKFTPVPFREDDIWNGYPEETNAPYGIAKKMMLAQSQAYRQQYGFNSIFLLPVNLYGPGDNFTFRSSHVIPALIRKFHLANLLSRGDFAAIVRDFQFNHETDLIMDGKPFTAGPDSPLHDLVTLLAQFGISYTDGWKTGRSGSLGRPQASSAGATVPSELSGVLDNEAANRPRDVIVHRPSSIGSSTIVEVWGTGSATREFFYVEDAAEAIILAMEQYDKSEPINIGTGFEISIRDLVALLIRLTGYTGQVVWDSTKPDGQPRRMLDTTRSEQEFGFKAKTGFEEGLRKTIEWYKKE